MLKKFQILTVIIALGGMLMLAGCNRNYYSGTGKGGKNCGCPTTKGL